MQTAYRPSAAKGVTDDYRCFLLDPKQAGDAFVTSVRIEPGQPKVVHHVILFRVPPTQVAAAKTLDAWRFRPGLVVLRRNRPSGGRRRGHRRLAERRELDRRLGARLGREPASRGHRRLAARRAARIVMQVHYNLLNGSAPDRSRALLTVAPASAGLEPLQTMLLPGPVELACAKGEKGKLCDRNEALFDLARKYGAGAAFTPAGLLILCRGKRRQPGGERRLDLRSPHLDADHDPRRRRPHAPARLRRSGSS